MIRFCYIIAELDKIEPAARAEAKALGYALGRECGVAKLPRSFHEFHAAAPEAFDAGAEISESVGQALFLECDGARGFLCSAGRELIMDMGRAKLFKNEAHAKMALRNLRGYGGVITAKLVKARLHVESYRTLSGSTAEVDELDSAVSRVESSALDVALSASRLEALEARGSQDAVAARTKANRL